MFNTDFTLALNKAVELAAQFRSNAQKEVCLMTDSRPRGTNSEGFESAGTLKSSKNVRPGTVLLNGGHSADDDMLILQQLASNLHLLVEEDAAGSLASQLQSLSTNQILAATINQERHFQVSTNFRMLE